MLIKKEKNNFLVKKLFIAAIIAILFVGITCCLVGCNGEAQNPITFVLQYDATEGGYISGQTKQELAAGQSGTQVKAVVYPGYRFVGWSDGLQEEKRIDENVTDSHIFIANFEKKDIYMAQYHSGAGGTVSGKIGDNRWGYNVQYVHGTGIYSKTFPVAATPNDGYMFLTWSDGITEPTRQDALQSDLNVTAYFRLIDFSSVYTVYNDKGGKVTIEFSDDGLDSVANVTAVPNKGYVFSAWSDLNANTTRTEKTALTAEKYVEHAAFFEPIEKTFAYDYGFADMPPLKNSITLNRDSLRQDCTAFVTPTRTGYVFDGWFADEDYKVKVADCNGTYMLGYYGLSLETDTLYAKWKNEGDADEVTTFRILVSFIDSVQARLCLSSNIDEEIFEDVDYQMTAIEREIFVKTTPMVSQLLNEWFNGSVLFEVDMYFTIDTINEDSIITVDSGNLYAPMILRRHFAYTDDVKKFKDQYNSITTLYNMSIGSLMEHHYGVTSVPFDFTLELDDYYRPHGGILAHLNSLIAHEKQPEIAYETPSDVYEFRTPLFHIFDGLMYNITEWARYSARKYGFGLGVVCGWTDIVAGFHKVNEVRDYFLGDIIVEGEKKGVPSVYWTDGWNGIRHWEEVDENSIN